MRRFAISLITALAALPALSLATLSKAEPVETTHFEKTAQERMEIFAPYSLGDAIFIPAPSIEGASSHTLPARMLNAIRIEDGEQSH